MPELFQPAIKKLLKLATLFAIAYQLKQELRNWALQVAHWFPALKPAADRRVAEYQT